MKKIYSLIFVALAGLAANAQVDVTFNVDMSNETVNPNGVHIAGNFSSNGNTGLIDWNPSAYMMTDEDLDGVYSYTFQLNEGAYEFKFINGDNWNDGMGNNWVESVPGTCQKGGGNDNREIWVSAATSYSTCFANCVACGENAVRFSVDMTLVDEDGDGTAGEFGEDINPVGVHVAGDFQGWSSSGNPLYDNDGNGVWEAVYSVGTATSVEFKYINGNDWLNPNENITGSCGPNNGNRSAVIEVANTTLPSYCWNACDLCVQPTQVTFMVDMSLQTVSPNGVHVAGSFQGWSPGDMAYAMTDDNSDGIYTLTVGLQPGSYQYKFVNGNDWSGADNSNETIPGGCASNGNRSLEVASEAVTQHFCYGQCTAECVIDPNPADITFRVNMENTTPSADGVWVIGNFTNPQWQGGAIALSDTDGDMVYEATATVSGPAEFFYKFVNGNVNTPDWEDGLPATDGSSSGIADCGIANGIGGYNRSYTRSGDAEVLTLVCFNECADCEVSVGEVNVVSNLNVFPNPVDNALNINFNTGLAQHIVINVLNSLGQVVATEDLGTVAGSRVVQVDVDNLAAGIYTLQISNGVAVQSAHIAVK
jgi:hypothetical protein